VSALRTLLAALPEPPAWRYDWDALWAIAPLAALLDPMAHTPQNPAWHGEGDVWTHTRWVCEALCSLEGFRALAADARRALALAALLHDAGKPAVTRLEGGEWVAPRHGPAGARLVRRLLWRDLGLCGAPEAAAFRESVCLLVRYHARPLHLLDADDPETTALRLASNGALAPGFTWESLCLLAEADALGRVAPDTRALVEAVALARAQAEEAGCLAGPYPFRSAAVRRALFTGGRVWKDQEIYDSTWGEVILMSGLPGTGKDTWLAEHCPDLPVVSLDAVRRRMGALPTGDQGPVAQAARELAREHLRARRPFAWNATGLSARQRGQQVELFEQYGAAVRIVYLETAWDENLRRNARRPDAVPEDVIDEMLGVLSPPEVFEARHVEWICV